MTSTISLKEDEDVVTFKEDVSEEIGNEEIGAGYIRGSEPVTMDHLHHLKEFLALNQSDIRWLTGMPVSSWYAGAEISPSLALMVRIYDMHPELVPIPTYPSYEQMYDQIEPFFMSRYGGKKLAHTRMGTLFGVGKWAGYSWSKPGSKDQSPTRKRLFLAAYTMIDKSKQEARIKEEYVEQQLADMGIHISYKDIIKHYPTEQEQKELGINIAFEDIEKTRKKGFLDFLRIVEAEARARGYRDLDHLYREGWHNGDKKDTDVENAGDDEQDERVAQAG